MKLITKWGLIFGVVALTTAAIPMAQIAISHTNEFSSQQLASWRDKGPAGLAQFVALHQQELDKNTLNPPKNDPHWTQLCAALDFIGGQKDNYASRLYWFTDLDKAKVLSQTEHKPILSLRLLGNLTDELSCANSRFFRTALYPNTKINKLLREEFILHWSSERPVPIVTIDMGDGRKIKRTLTGNSTHYLLSSDGTPLDALPGLNAPGAFERWLKGSIQLYTDYAKKPQNARADYLADYHQQALKDSILEIRPNIADKIDSTIQAIKKRNPLLTPSPTHIPAIVAASLPVTKSIGELPLLKGTQLLSGSALDGIIPGSYMSRSAKYASDSKLDLNSLALLRSKNPILISNPSQTRFSPIERIDATIQYPSFLSETPLISGRIKGFNTILQPTTDLAPFDQLVQNFERAIALDTARNYTLHTSIHALFAENKQGTFEDLNRKIYDRLFLTPQSDRWLGLDTPGIYTGIVNGGIIKDK